ncbi:MAG TPA: hypothetical protein VH143_22740 [Kofleriaceae bacterium]|nr:hypothetical protein [Kofleriaceae bacterium]
MRRLTIVGIICCSLVAHADGKKSRTVAQALSGGGTALASVLVLAGFLGAPSGEEFEKPVLYTGIATAAILPSLGEVYAGEYLTYGMAARVFAAGLATVALTTQMKTETCDDATMANQQCTKLQGAGYALMGIAAIAFVGGMAYDVQDAGNAADRWNVAHGFTATIVPTAFVTPNGQTVPGLALGGRF